MIQLDKTIEGLTVYDDFLPAPNATRAHALLSEYYDWEGFDGETYKRVSLLRVPGLLASIQQAVGPVHMLGMGYRLNYADEMPNQSIHTDVGWGTHALVLYLQEGESGTAFWQHRKTGANSIEAGQVDLYDDIKDDWEDHKKWEIREIVEMKYNRALIYESKLFHSRFPFKAFGDNPENGRLIAVAFFTPEYPL